MHAFAAGRDSITYQSQQKWVSHFQEQFKKRVLFPATWKHWCFHAFHQRADIWQWVMEIKNMLSTLATIPNLAMSQIWKKQSCIYS